MCAGPEAGSVAYLRAGAARGSEGRLVGRGMLMTVTHILVRGAGRAG
jgi:hypothetical protein